MANSPQQRDYGHEGSTTPLVPGSLRLYRHFKANAAHLQPMNTMFRGLNPYETPQPLYTAECMKEARGTQSWANQVFASSSYGNGGAPSHGEAPVKTCQCGFYAHYDQETDFYPSMDWNIKAIATGGHIFVKAVIEAQGRVVLGTKGIRAQKIKIIAIAADWNKWRSPEWATAVENAQSYDEYRGLRDNPQSFKPKPGEFQQVFQTVSMVGLKYNVMVMSDTDALHSLYPPQDVTELLKTEEIPPVPKRANGYLKD